MPARKKWRRKLTVQGRPFLWYVKDDPDGMGPVLHLFTPDKTIVAWYWLGRKRAYPSIRVAVVAGRGFTLPVEDLPDWEPREVATLSFVAEVAEWQLQRRQQRQESPGRGTPVRVTKKGAQ
jgi:hypothetical protein